MKLRINQEYLRVIVIIAAIVLVLVLVFALLSTWESGRGAVDTDHIDPENDGRISYNGQWYVPNSKLQTILVIGLDKFTEDISEESYRNSQQSDFLLLLILDRAEESYTALHLNRDTMAQIPVLGVRGEDAGVIEGQLALAHTYGSGGADSCRNTVSAVSDFLFGAQIDHYISFTMDAVGEINDLVGGVTVTLSEDFSAVDAAMCEGATLTLNGDQALTYVRYRRGLEDSSNISRMERQRTYLSLLRERFSEASDQNSSFFVDAMNAVSEYIVSDCTASQLSRLFDDLSAYCNDGFVTLDGESVKGEEFMEFYVDESVMKQKLISLLYLPVADE